MRICFLGFAEGRALFSEGKLSGKEVIAESLAEKQEFRNNASPNHTIPSKNDSLARMRVRGANSPRFFDDFTTGMSGRTDFSSNRTYPALDVTAITLKHLCGDKRLQ